ncbi:SPOR domain-containing protein [Flavilitoribacter nigricans]|uniref:SPOR domain-containing protein n=1 Tax=Flavilitoribacter nigricans (strain ATCC 23147 / DSM 23189 / NBRC 102662 / NCIMB 1420 / SS-2) TaxID=1122177 RepID=A0A2D0NAD3_FLAN2|nr:SPOR domain-containing protein [Flavilitoribacter nigricans]PHN05336.1 hypothetical protein CRP01_17625 [Flavilitoribacter nigricans DSM 23189 = NBRC 102662]
MSRLDWFTILIVGICVIALGFLVYKTVQLMGNDQPDLDRSEIADDPTDRNEHQMAYESSGSARTDDATTPGADDQDLDDDELPYDPQEVEAPQGEEVSTPEPPKSTTTKSSESSSASKTASEPRSQPTASSTTPKGGTPTSYSSSSGDFMVVAGSFSMRQNAETQVKKLKQLGYDNARVEIFNGGALATALVDRFDNYDRAKNLVTELKGKGVDCFVKRKE